MISSLRVLQGNERKKESQLEKAFASTALTGGLAGCELLYSATPSPAMKAKTCERDSKQILYLVNCFSQVFDPNDEKAN